MFSDLGCTKEENRDESKIQAPLLDELILHLAKLKFTCQHYCILFMQRNMTLFFVFKVSKDII